MIQIIDYQDNLFGLLLIGEISPKTLKIDGIEYTIGSSEYTLPDIPTEIFEKITYPSKIIGYSSGAEMCTVDEYNTMMRSLTAAATYTDDGVMWDTREDKRLYDEFVAKWKCAYSEPTFEWKPVDFQLVVKERVPDKYRDYIESSIIIGSTGYGRAPRKAVCTYRSRPKKMIEEIAERLGFSITLDDKNTQGKKIFIYTNVPDNILRYSKVNDKYFGFPEEIYKKYGDVNGSLAACIDKYEWEYNQIYEYLLGISNVIDNPSVTLEERKKLATMMDEIFLTMKKVTPTKSGLDHYNRSMTLLSTFRRTLQILDTQGQ